MTAVPASSSSWRSRSTISPRSDVARASSTYRMDAQARRSGWALGVGIRFYSDRVNQQSPEPYRPRDASQLRISDDDRHSVAEMLRQAAGEGRLDITELQERLEATYQAKTYGDLVPITA